MNALLLSSKDAQPIRDTLQGLQQDIIRGLEALDGSRFVQDTWQRAEGGGGISAVLEDSTLFERAGVLFSDVQGTHLPPSASAQRPGLAGRPFSATGVSLVLHPRNPYVPTVHMNVRCFIAAGVTHAPPQSPEAQSVWWFGGGMDLTPYYGFEEDAQHFHQTCRQAVDPFDRALYPRFKRACDDYFFLKHRQEARGIGGIFFDDFTELGFAQSWAMTQSVGQSFLSAYAPIVQRRQHQPYGTRERAFQAYRRGRYVEFNLVHDRGTLFGLQSGGRTESILVSLPPVVSWRYQWHPEPGSPEARLYEVFLPPRAWV